MVYTYVGKGTIILGARNKPVEALKPNDKVIGYYIGIGPKRYVESRVKSVRYVGKTECKLVGSCSEHALIADGQKSIDSTFKYVDIGDIVYSVGRVVPRPFKVHETIQTDVYELELKDSDIVPLLTSYMFIAFTDKQLNLNLNFQGGLSGKEKSKKESKGSKGQSNRSRQSKDNKDNKNNEDNENETKIKVKIKKEQKKGGRRRKSN